MRIALVVAAAAVLAAPVRGAEFEGMLVQKMTVQGGGVSGGGAMKVWISRAGTRMEMEMGAGGGAMKMTTVVLKSSPGVAFLVNDAKKTYSEIDTTKSAAPARGEEETFTVKKLGNEKVAGFDCAHVQIKGNKGTDFEIWSTKDLGTGSEYWASQRGASRSNLVKAMRDASVEGWPVKTVHHTGEMTTTMELVKADRRTVPPALLDLSGYTKSQEAGYGAAASQMQLSPEQQKRMDEAMKNLTPEQRKQMEEMMKGRQGGAAPKSN